MLLRFDFTCYESIVQNTGVLELCIYVSRHMKVVTGVEYSPVFN